MLRDFTEQSRKIEDGVLDKIRETLQRKSELEARIVQDIINFEDEYKVIIDKIRFQRMITRTPKTIYTELTLLLE